MTDLGFMESVYICTIMEEKDTPMSTTYIATARRYRPQRFADVVGQETATEPLRRAVATGRVATAYIFSGTRGTGKTTTARILARALVCQNPRDGEPCNECDACKDALKGTHPDIIELDAASNNSVDDIRRLTESTHIPPQRANHKTYIIDEAHMLTSQAFNALLKTLEEPENLGTHFILATTEPEKIIPTVKSRAIELRFNPLTLEQITAHLQNIAQLLGTPISQATAQSIARSARGAVRDALTHLDKYLLTGTTQDAAEQDAEENPYDKQISLLSAALLLGHQMHALSQYAQARKSNATPQSIINDLRTQLLAHLYIAANIQTNAQAAPLLEHIRTNQGPQYIEHTQRYTTHILRRLAQATDTEGASEHVSPEAQAQAVKRLQVLVPATLAMLAAHAPQTKATDQNADLAAQIAILLAATHNQPKTQPQETAAPRIEASAEATPEPAPAPKPATNPNPAPAPAPQPQQTPMPTIAAVTPTEVPKAAPQPNPQPAPVATHEPAANTPAVATQQQQTAELLARHPSLTDLTNSLNLHITP